MMTRLSTSFVVASVLPLTAQTPQAVLPAPAPIGQVSYQHWPEQFVQWIGTELPYSMIELYVDSTKAEHPVYDVVLTERASGKRVHYSNQQFMVDINKSIGAEAYQTGIELDRPADSASDRSYYVRFNDHKGEPVVWQFVQGSEITERGGGLSPAGSQPPVIMYREQSAVAGQGTAIKIGNVVSAADVWTEIAQPPYFVPYHGALTANLEIAAFTGSEEQWKTVQAPSKLEAGAAWTLEGANGHSCKLTVAAVKGDVVTLSQEDSYAPGQKVSLEAQFAGGNWTTKKVHFTPSGPNTSKGITLAFTPGLSPSGEQSKFELFSGTKTRIASGVVHVDGKDMRTDWRFKDPEWLKNKPAVAQSHKDSGQSAAGGQ